MKAALADRLGPFVRRVRSIRLWQGAARGLILGSLVACLTIAWFRLHGHIAPWPLPVTLLAVPTVIWALWAFTLPVPKPMLARSLDRRGHLSDRLATALEMPEGAFAEALQDDAEASLGSVTPSRAYPIRFGRLQGFAVLLALIAGGATLLGNRPVTLSASEMARRADAQDAAANIERVLSPYQTPEAKKSASPELTKEVNELDKLAMDLKNDKTSRDEALRKANEIEDQAKKLEQKDVKDARSQLEQAETAMQKAEASDQDAPFDPAAENPPEQANAQADDLQKQIDQEKKLLESMKGAEANQLKSDIAAKEAKRDDLRRQASEAQAMREAFSNAAKQNMDGMKSIEDALQIDSASNSGAMDPLAEFKMLQMRLMASTQAEIANIKERLKTATGAEAERLRKKLAELESQLDAVKKKVDAYNKALRAALKAAKQKKASAPSQKSVQLQHTKLNKPMRDALNHLEDALHQIESGDDLTKEQIAQLKSISTKMQSEAVMAKAEGDSARAMTAAVLADAAEKLATGMAGVSVGSAAAGATSGMGIPPQRMHRGPGGPGYVPTSLEHNWHKVNHLDKAEEGKGKTTPALDQSDMNGDGPESYIELKGPASLNGRSAVPYKSVLPSYQRKAESALNGGNIPKKHQKRVRAYFDSLNGR